MDEKGYNHVIFQPAAQKQLFQMCPKVVVQDVLVKFGLKLDGQASKDPPVNHGERLSTPTLYSCHLCAVRDLDKKAISNHIAVTHNCACHICGKQFNKAKAFKLIQHYKKKHTIREDKLTSDSKDGKQVVQTSILEQHFEKKQAFTCVECNLTFNSLTGITQHMLSEHEQNSKRKAESCTSNDAEASKEKRRMTGRTVNSGNDDTVSVCSLPLPLEWEEDSFEDPVEVTPLETTASASSDPLANLKFLINVGEHQKQSKGSVEDSGVCEPIERSENYVEGNDSGPQSTNVGGDYTHQQLWKDLQDKAQMKSSPKPEEKPTQPKFLTNTALQNSVSTSQAKFVSSTVKSMPAPAQRKISPSTHVTSKESIAVSSSNSTRPGERNILPKVPVTSKHSVATSSSQTTLPDSSPQVSSVANKYQLAPLHQRYVTPTSTPNTSRMSVLKQPILTAAQTVGSLTDKLSTTMSTTTVSNGAGQRMVLGFLGAATVNRTNLPASKSNLSVASSGFQSNQGTTTRCHPVLNDQSSLNQSRVHPSPIPFNSVTYSQLASFSRAQGNSGLNQPSVSTNASIIPNQFVSSEAAAHRANALNSYTNQPHCTAYSGLSALASMVTTQSNMNQSRNSASASISAEAIQSQLVPILQRIGRDCVKCKVCDKTMLISEAKKHLISRHPGYVKLRVAQVKQGLQQPASNSDREFEQSAGDYMLLLKCENCSYSTTDGKKLADHIATLHRNAFLLQCEYCDYKSLYSANIRHHVDTFHKWRYCDMCDFSSRDQVFLNDHVSAVHLGLI